MSATRTFRQWVFANRGILPVPLVFVGVAAMFFVSERGVDAVPWLDAAWNAVAALVIVWGEAWRAQSVGFSGSTTRSRTITAEALATGGPYSQVRNPIYVGNFLIGLGLTLLGEFWWLGLIYVAYFAAVYSLIVSAEEEFLEGKFGQPYREYLCSVPRWRPRDPFYPLKTLRWSDLRNPALSGEYKTVLGAVCIALAVKLSEWVASGRVRLSTDALLEPQCWLALSIIAYLLYLGRLRLRKGASPKDDEALAVGIAAVAAIVAFYGWEAAQRAIVIGSEARYAEISREMFASKDWLVPRYYGFAHLHKPPVAYWLTAFAYTLFGVNELATRLFVIAAALLGVVLTGAIGALVLGRRAGVVSAMILGSSGLWWMMGQTLTTDMYLSIVTALAYWAFFKARLATRPTAYLVLFWACLGLSVLTKMQAGILVIAVPIAAWAVLEGYGCRRLLESLRFWPVGAGVFTLTALPWYLILVLKYPELARYWIGDHVFGRFFVESKFARGGPVYYFVGVLAVGFLPWILWLVPAVRQAWRQQKAEVRLIVLWFLIPFAVFSLSRSKLPPYILPLFPALALLVGRYWDERAKSDGARRLALRGALAFSALSLACAAALVAARHAAPLQVSFGYLPLLLGVCGPLAVAAWSVSEKSGSARLAFGGLVAAVCLFWLGTLEGSRRVEIELAPYKRLAQRLKSEAANEDLVVEYKVNTAGLPFYLGKVPLLWKESLELALRQDRRQEGRLNKSRWDELKAAAGPSGRVYIVTKRKLMPEFVRDEPVYAEPVASAGQYVLVRVKGSKGAPKSPQAAPPERPAIPLRDALVAGAPGRSVWIARAAPPPILSLPLVSTSAAAAQAPAYIRQRPFEDVLARRPSGKWPGRLMFAGSMAGTFAFVAAKDSPINASLRRFRGAPAAETTELDGLGGRGTVFDTLGRPAGALGTAGAFYLAGSLVGSETARRTGVLAAEAWLVSEAATGLITKAAGRARPGTGTHDSDDFSPFSAHDSFPSRHTSAAFAVAAVVADNSKSAWVPIVGYGAAAMVGAGRIVQGRQWASDVLAGALLGYGSGKLVSGWERRTGWSVGLYGGTGAFVKKRF